MMLMNPKIMQEIGYILFSYTSSVSIIFLNKYIYNDRQVAGTLLMSLHFLSNFFISGCLILASQYFPTLSIFKSKIVPVRTGIWMSLNIASAIFVGNLSLIHNPITVYQLAKLMVIPCILLINYVWFKTVVEPKIFASLMTIVAGMIFVLYTDFYLNSLGFLLAALAIIFGATSQIVSTYIYSME